ncbi:MAG TPA: tetratricopeptide repeat protein [Polyangiaceae bacterium]|jgi:tetratricopeptide (TPR) repeat protein
MIWSRSTRRVAPLCLLLPALSLLPAAAMAEGGKGASKKPAATVDSSASTTASPKYKEACTQGNTKYAARDFPGAIASYQKAIELDPKNPLGHYFLGEAQLAAGNTMEAEAAWNRASLEASDKDPALRARILFVLADLKERQKRWDDARAAWQVYLDWASKYPAAGAFPTSAQSRQQVIDAMQKQDKAYAVVRQRIADTKAGGVFSDLSKSPPAK